MSEPGSDTREAAETASGGTRRPRGSDAQVDDRSTAARLIETAAALFRRKGYAASTTRELAELLGIQKASLYYHMSGKDDLLVTICHESLRRITDQVREVAESGPAESRLANVIERHVVTALHDRDMHAVMLIELRALPVERRTSVIERRDQYQHLLHELIESEQKAGRIRADIETKYLTLSLLNLLNWTIFWFDPEGDMAPQELGRTLATIFVEGARSRP
ncbi:MAG TPA: TetR/AcrR family transcriptional regulator [Solirubrobacteraceae bacterium]|nr:TetR/AcrR family transcriptional regulator [Solirubrobacteraceae bacterium]